MENLIVVWDQLEPNVHINITDKLIISKRRGGPKHNTVVQTRCQRIIFKISHWNLNVSTFLIIKAYVHT